MANKKKVFILPYETVEQGWIEVEADDVHEALKLANDHEYLVDAEEHFKSGTTTYIVDEMYLSEGEDDAKN